MAVDERMPWPSPLLKIVGDQGVAGELVDGLIGELPGTIVLPLDLGAPPPAAGVLLVRLRGDEPETFLAEIVAWAGHRVGLLACTATGTPEPALAAGFDDAVVVGISAREIAARVRAIHRRIRQADRSGRLRYGPVALDADTFTMWVDGEEHTLTMLELAVMRALVRAHGRTLTRDDLLDAAWGDADLEISERAVDNVILRLRRKLSRPNVIETVRGVGFRLAPS
ncbi:MAG TPA: response regulator transcription factor [Kofleriaceae bacterium]|nr:response regulator transcription factor [Kofleriaceae bacterium]